MLYYTLSIAFTLKGASHEQTPSKSTRRCCIPNIKALRLPVSEKKNFEDGLLCSYVPTCDLRGRTSFAPGASDEQTWLRSTRRCYIPNIKALALTVWDKKIFKDFLIYLYVQSENLQHKANFNISTVI